MLKAQNIDHYQCEYRNPYGKFKVKPLQKIEIDINLHTPLIHQPENYLIGNEEWSQKFTIQSSEVLEYLDSPDSLWGVDNKVDFSQIKYGEMQITQSLYLVKVDDLHFYRNTENKRRASFYYNMNNYVLPVTDPNFDMLLNNPKHQSILCISLGEKYDPNGGDNFSCYKIVATIL